MSYTGITNGIIGITDNGLNTAAEMRSLLTEMSLEYFPYVGATKNVTSNYLYFSNVSNNTISAATGTVLITKDYLINELSSLSGSPQGLQSVLDTGDTAYDIGINIFSSTTGRGVQIYPEGSIGLLGVSGSTLSLSLTVADPQLNMSNQAGGTISLSLKSGTTSNMYFDFPDKISGTYTLATLDDITSGGTSSTGLEALDEGNGIGWRLIGRNPAQFGNIGKNAVDFSSYYADATAGALGEVSVAFGEDNKSSGWGSFTVGSNNIASNSYSIAMQGHNTASGFSDFVIGGNNSANSFHAAFVSGRGNISTSAMGITSGIGLRNTNSYGATVLGTANIPFTGSGGSFSGTDPLFVIGNGTFTTPVGSGWTAITPKNAIHLTRSGVFTLPSLTTAMINAETTGKVAVTREWVAAQGYSTGSTTPNLQQVLDAGQSSVGNPLYIFDGVEGETTLYPNGSIGMYGSNGTTEIGILTDTASISFTTNRANNYKTNLKADFSSAGVADILLPTKSGKLLALSDITTAPTSSTDTGSKGEVRIVGGYRYECIATNTWVRSAVEITW